MASVYNFTFDNLTGLNDDSCSISEREMQNQNFGNYNVQSYFLQNCGMTKPIAFATSLSLTLIDPQIANFSGFPV